MPWPFHAKLTAAALLTLLVTYIHTLEGRAKRGDTAAGARIPTVGKGTLLFAVMAVVFAVLTFH
jgi:hypothetical protein